MDRSRGRRASGSRIKLPTPGEIIAGILRLGLRSGVWAAVLLLIDLAAPYTGVSLSASPIGALTCGLLGVPGLGVLLWTSALF